MSLEIDYESIIDFVTKAHTHLGILEGIGRTIPNPNLLIYPYITAEAVASSRIEGTEASALDVFQFKARQISDRQVRSKRVLEVNNYIDALGDCLARIGRGESISLTTLRLAHGILMRGVMEQHTMPGRFRTIQNWIGHQNSRIEDAKYVPPAPHLLDDLLSDMMQFVMNPPLKMPVLVQCALVHCQFEMIHPFTDGNGRVGRLLIPLILAHKSALSKPLLYLSSYFERNRTEYYRHLQNVSKNSDWMEWIKFFLEGVIQCSSEAVDATSNLLRLRSTYEEKLKKAPRSAIILTGRLFANPVVTIPLAAKYLEMGYPPAKKAIMHLVEMGILEQIGSRKRGKTYVAKEILNVLAVE